MRTLALLSFSLIGLSAIAQNTFGDIIGTYQEKSDKSAIVGATVFTSSGTQIYKTVTDIDGRFRISAIPAGTYELSFVFLGDTIVSPSLVDVAPDGIGDAGITYNAQTLEGQVVYADALRLKRGVNPEIKLTGKDIRVSSAKFNTKDLVTTMTSEVKKTSNGELQFRGARAGDVICYLDGVKMNDVPPVPSAAIGYMMVYSGAVPAKYGDTLGGIVVIETLSYTDLWKEWKRKTGQE